MEKIFLGGFEGGKQIFWDPDKEKNPHFLVVGTSGSGKTETVKAIILELKRQGIPSLIFDFHDDFTELGDYTLDVSKESFNLLAPAWNQKPIDLCYQIANIIAKVYGLGIIQQGIIRDAIKSTYEELGINLHEEAGHELDFPTLKFVKERLWSSSEKEIERVKARCSDLFELNIFSENTGEVEFKEILKKTTVINLHDFPTEDVKVAISEFFLNKLRYELYKIGKKDSVYGYVVVDEAHRLTYEESPVDALLRESRKYGFGVILSSQRPSDFSNTTLANVGSVIALQCSLVHDAKAVANHLGCSYYLIKDLQEPGLGYIWTTNRIVPEKIKIKPWKERLTEEEKIEINKKHDIQIKLISKEQKDFHDKALHWERNSKELQKKVTEIQEALAGKKNEIEQLKFNIEKIEEEKKELQKEVGRKIDTAEQIEKLKLKKHIGKLKAKYQQAEKKNTELQKKVNILINKLNSTTTPDPNQTQSNILWLINKLNSTTTPDPKRQENYETETPSNDEIETNSIKQYNEPEKTCKKCKKNIERYCIYCIHCGEKYESLVS